MSFVREEKMPDGRAERESPQSSLKQMMNAEEKEQDQKQRKKICEIVKYGWRK